MSVLNAARNEIDSNVALSSGRGGKLFKHLVVLELIRLNDYYERGFKFSHYRERETCEIDLIMQQNFREPPVAIEIKVEEAPTAGELNTLIKFKAENPEAHCYCLTAGTASLELAGVQIMPWEAGIKAILGLGDPTINLPHQL